MLAVWVNLCGCQARAIATPAEDQLFLQAWGIVSRAYVDGDFNGQDWWTVRQEFLKRNFETRDQTYEAIEEMLGRLDDPFTRLLRPEKYTNLKVSTSGELFGVGIQIYTDPETEYVETIAPIPGSPAEAAGIKPRDRILRIDGTDTRELSLDDAAELLRGEQGTTVMLTVESARLNQQETDVRDVEIVRDRIELNPVTAILDTTTGEIPVGYIRLNQFNGNAAREVAVAVENLRGEGAQALVLDLRNNPGGLLAAGIEIARLFIDRGTIVYTVDRSGMLGSYDATESAIADEPMMVLVNEGTASASEILAGALQDNHRAQLLGMTTFGKGLIQSLFELPDDSGLAVTVAKYETPSHRDINRLGIEPDYIVPQESNIIPTTDADVQYQQAIALLSDQ